MRIRTTSTKRNFSKSPTVQPIQKKKLSSLHGIAQPKPKGQSLEEMRISRANAERLGDHMVNLSGTFQAQPVQTKLTVGEVGDKYEQEADATAAQVVKQINSPEAQGSLQRDAKEENSAEGRNLAGQEQESSTEKFRGSEKPFTINSGNGSLQTSIQRYYDHGGFRMSDDGKMGVHQARSIGGQTAYATPDLIKDASDQLKAATSVIELKPGNESGKIYDLDDNPHDVVDVVPVNTKNETEGSNMDLWADCGRSAKTVSGMDQGTGQGHASPRAKYSKDGKTKTVTGNDWMEIQKVKMFRSLFSTENPWWKFWKAKYEGKLDIKTISKKLSDYNKLKKQWLKEKDEDKKGKIGKEMSKLASEMDVLARAEYEKLDPEAKDDFDKQAGINMYADPEIGEAFHISSGGNDHPDKPANAKTWNFHWAGAALKSGSDTVTLENYSVSNYNKENKDWVFQMYGVGKEGQSFHEEHKDVHKQHGDAPTSMVAVRKQAQDK